MSLFRKFFGSINPASDEDKESEFSKSFTDNATSVDEKFIYNFKKNGGKFLYCENSEEVSEHFENILEENDWFCGTCSKTSRRESAQGQREGPFCRLCEKSTTAE